MIKDDVYKPIVTTKHVKATKPIVMSVEDVFKRKTSSKETKVSVVMKVKAIATHTSNSYLDRLTSYFDVVDESSSNYFDKSAFSDMKRG